MKTPHEQIPRDKRRIIISSAVALLVAILYTLMCWLGGYDFDHRNEGVALAFSFGCIVVAASFWAAFAAYEILK